MLHYMYVTNGAVKILITFCKSTVKLVPVVFLNHHILTNNEINIVYKIVCCYFPVWLIVIITAVNSAPMEHLYLFTFDAKCKQCKLPDVHGPFQQQP